MDHHEAEARLLIRRVGSDVVLSAMIALQADEIFKASEKRDLDAEGVAKTRLQILIKTRDALR